MASCGGLQLNLRFRQEEFDQLIRKVSFVLWRLTDSIQEVGEKRIMAKILTVTYFMIEQFVVLNN